MNVCSRRCTSAKPPTPCCSAEFRQSLKDDVSKMLAVVVGHPEVWQPGNASAQQAGGALLSLFEMAAACADVISGKQGASDATQQLRSFATLNALWVALVGSLSAVHDDAVDLLASRPAGQLSAASVLAKALAQLDAARADFMASGAATGLPAPKLIFRAAFPHQCDLPASTTRSTLHRQPLHSPSAPFLASSRSFFRHLRSWV